MMDEDLSPDDRRQHIAEILATGILRLRTSHALMRMAEDEPADSSPESSQKSLELSSPPRTHVTAG